ncbi:MAG: hypothetical protein ACRYFS_12255 [Janthinobacterium lividum]
MAPPSLIVWLISLLALFSVVTPPDPAQSDPIAAAPARTVEGIATTPDGKPLPRVTLYLFGLPPGQTDMITLGDQSTVVTDNQGHFTWAVPDALPPLSDYIGVRSIACYALAADRGTERLRLTVRPNWHGTDATGAARNLLEQVTRPCETSWKTGGTHPVFSVVVPQTSAVELLVRGPDGKPVREREVQVVPVGLTYDYMGAAIDIARIDAAGHLRLRCFPGSLRFQVFVPGLGFGSTGTFDAAVGQSVTPLMPPLAPFARLSGTVAPALAVPGAVVHQDSLFASGNVWYDPHGVVDASGHWTMTDVLPGANHLILTGGRGESESVSVTALPGQHVGDITISPKKQPDPETILLLKAVSGGNLSDATLSVRGKVTEANGRPAVGADVYVVFSPSVGLGSRSGQKVLVSKTDASGAYLISGLPVWDGLTGTAAHLVARQPGFSLAVTDGQSEKGQISGRWGDIEQDLVLPATHAGLTVQVLRDGKPCPNVLVALTAPGENSVIPDMFRESDRGAAAQTLRKMLAPSGQTGPDGVVRFTDLSPGLWDVTANRAPNFYVTPGTTVPPFNTSKGIVVQAGKAQSYTLSLLPTPSDVTFRILSPTSVPVFAGREVVTLKTANDPNYGNLSLTPDSVGNGLGQFVVPGLFQVTARYGDKPLDINPLAGPYYEGTDWIAVSAATDYSHPLTIPTERIGPASIRVRLVDAQGKPLHGAVTIGERSGNPLYAASVGASGEVVFPNVALNFFPYMVTAHIEGRPDRVILPQRKGPLPPDAALIAGTGQPMPQSVHVQGGEETLVTFGLVPPGYVRLRLTGPLASAKFYYIEGRQTDDEPFTEAHFDPAVGEYLLGPLPSGPRTFHLFCYVPAPVDANLDAAEIAMTVKAGQVVSATLAPQSTAAQEALYSAPLSGTVFLADGKTPAWGARAALFLPERSVPIRMMQTDTQGRLVVNDFWRSGARSRIAPPGNPTEPVVVVWLPGDSGAVIVPFHPGQDLRLVLPTPIALHGRVTVGGQSVLGLPSQFRIRAAYQDKGWLNEALSVEATAQADGTFDLAGLTPGTYQVQASRDNIWLSGTQTLTVGAEALPEMALDIAPPGAPVILTLEDPKGQPLPNQKVQIVRPDGPLTSEIWPATLTTSSTGSLRVDGLEAGHHLVMVPGRAGESLGFDVPAWTSTAPPETRRIVVPPGR